MTKVCTMCGESKPLSVFRTRGGTQNHLHKSRCNSCLRIEHRRWADKNPDKIREYKKKYSWTLAKRCARRGISPGKLVAALEHQKYCCAICLIKISIANSAIDHNHDTGDFRGVLCTQCNLALGMFKDSPNVLRSALSYLEVMGNYGDNEDG